MLVQNTRTKTRKSYNQEYLKTLEDQDLFFVYGLVNMENGEVGYIGTTYSPRQRMQHHLHDLKCFTAGIYYRQSLAKVTWMANLPDLPEMKIFAVCLDRKDAEFIERGLVRQFEIEGNYHYWKFRKIHPVDENQVNLFEYDEKPF